MTKRTPLRTAPPVVEELEPRVLYSADLAPALLGASGLPLHAEHRTLDADGEFLQPQAPLETQAVQVSRELVFVDTRVADYQRLVDDIRKQAGDTRQFEVVLLDSNADGIEQISRTLDSEAGLSAVHIISHGGDGTVQLGGAVLDFDTLVRNATQIKGWGDAFADDADLLLYGCDVAATAEGRALVDALGRLTGTDVAASADLTGDAMLGGDWTLEFATGGIEARTVVDGAAPGAWSGVLAITANGSATSAKTDNATSLTWSHTVASGSNRALFVTVAIDGLGASVSGVTYGGVAMNQVGRTTGNHAVEIWSLVNPAVGTANVVVNFGGSTPAAAGAVTYNGVNQTTPTGTYAGASGTGTASSVTVTSAAGELVIDAENWRGSAAGYALGGGQSLLWSQTNTTNTGKSTTEAGAASVTMSSTVSSSAQWEIGAVSIKPVANSAPAISSNGGGASASVNVAENSTAVTTVTATDAEADSLSYSISGGADAAKFSINASTGALSFASAPNYESPTDSGANNVYDVTVQVSDGSLTDTQAIAVTVTNTNDAPVLDSTKSPALTAVGEDAGAPSGAVGTLVSSLVDFASPAGQADNVTDADAGAQLGIAVTAADTTNGTWWYSTNGGTNWNALGAVAGNNARLLAADASTRLYFQPNADYNGTLSSAITFRAWDRSAGSNGGLADTTSNGGTSAFSSATDTASLVVNAVNDPPVNSLPANAYTALNTAKTLSSANGNALQIADVDAASSSVSVTLSVTNGTLSLASTIGLTVTGGANGSATMTYTGTVSAFNTALNTGLTFTPTSGYRGLAQLTLATNDQGNTGTGSALSDTDTLNIHVGAIVVTNATDISNGTVTSIANLVANDGGDGISLREAIRATNATAGTDYIYFNISGAGPHTITPSSALPTITDALTIDGYTQSGASRNTLAVGSDAVLKIVLDGTNAGSSTHGLNITAGSTTVTGLVINNFSYSGVYLDVGDGNTIAGNYIGTDATGTVDLGNGRGTLWDGICIGDTSASDNNTIGGSSAGDRNVISGNSGAGIWMTSSNGGNTIRGNYIGVNAAGTSAISNGQHGVFLAGSGNVVTGNVISGNGQSGYYGIYAPSGASSSTIQSNIIGLNATGTAALPNADTGVYIESANNQIGGAGAGNAISGNSGYGLVLNGAGATGNQIQGNYIGTNAAGTAGIGNQADGIGLIGASNNTIGGTSAALRNVISGNNNSSSQADGVWISGGSGNTIQGNYIGTTADGTGAIGNYHAGVALSNTLNNIVGGTAAGAGNLIANSAGAGVTVSGSSTGNYVLGNSIYGNAGLGIDLGDDGVTANDPIANRDSDTGANNLQNFPVLATAATNGSTQVTIAGSFNSTASRYYRIEFFASAAADGSGYGEGQTYLGYVNVATDASGNATFNTTLGVAVAAGASISATATRSNATYTTFTDTSEFAQSIVAVGNSAPVLDTTKSPVLTATSEDAGAPSGAVGTLVSALVDFASPAGQVDNVTDADTGAQLGIAVTAADTTNGTWWYSTNGGTNWNALGAVAGNNARLLAADASTRLYFQPNADYNGTLSSAITFRAWDQSGGTNGGLADTTSNGGTSAFSSSTDTASLVLSAVNDAPTLTNGATVTLTATDENTTSSATTVSSILTGASWADVDTGASSGIAITGKSGNGTWQYSTDGVSWSSFGAVSTTNALLLTSASQVRYIPDGANGETATFSFKAWDQTSATASTNATPSYADPGAGGGTTPYSSASATASMSVAGVNDAPILDASKQPALSAINEDAGAPVGAVGTLVSQLVDFMSPAGQVDNVFDNDAGAQLGIAVVSASTTNGSWWYSTNGGTNWNALGAVAFANARLLAADADSRIYFQPNADYNGTLASAIMFRAWDQTSGSNGALANATSGGGSSAFSSSTDTASLVVNAVNDPPVNSITGVGAVIPEDTAMQLVGVISIADVDGGSGSFTVTLSVNTAAGTFTASTAAGVTVTGSGTDTLVLSGTLANINAYFASVNTAPFFTPTADYNGTVSVTLVTSDGGNTGSGGAQSDSDTASGTISAVADIANDSVTTNEDTPVTFAPLSNDSFENAGQTITHVNGDAIASGGSVAVTGGTVTLNPAGTLTYTPTANYNGTPSFTYTVTSGGVTETATVNVTVNSVNDAPVLDATNSPALTAIGEDAGAPSGAVGTLVSALVDFASPAGQVDNVTDADSGAQLGIAVTGADTSNGSWWYSTDGGSNWNALGVLSDASARLLTADANTRLYFQPSPNYNGTLAGAITFRAWDRTSGSNGALTDASTNGGATAFSSSSDTASLVVTAANDTPVAADVRLALNFDGVDDYVSVPSSASLVMSSTMTMEAWVNPDTSGNSVQMILNKEGEYEMAIFADGSLNFAFAEGGAWAWHDTGVDIARNAWSHVAITYNAGVVTTYVNGIVVNSQTMATAAIDDVYPAMNELRIGGRTNNPAGQYFDGRISDVRVWNVARSGAQIAADMNASLSGTEAGLAGYWRLDDNSGTTAADRTSNANSGTLVNGPVWAGYRIHEDTVLSVAAPGVLANDYDVDGDSLTAILVSGPAHGALTLNANGSFIYTPDANWNGTDSFSYRANDGTVSSNVATVTIVVDAVNDAPAGTNNTVITLEDTAYSFAASDFGFTDPNDSPANALSAVKITTLPGGGSLTLAGVAVTAGQTISIASINSGNLVFTPAANANGVGYASFTFQLQDDGGSANGGIDLDSTPNTITINVTAVNDAPVITPVAPDVTFVEGGMPQLIDPLGTVADVDSSDFNGGVLTVSVTQNASADDRLTVGNFGGGPGQVGVSGSNVTFGGTIVGSFAGGTSGSDPLVVTFNANATLAAVQEVRACIQFANVSDSPSTLTRQVTFALTDGDGGTAIPQTKLVYVQATNNAPVITSNGGGASAAINVAENSTAVTTVTSSDVDGGAPGYSIVGGADAALFSINATTGALSFVAAPNYESPTDSGGNNVYDVTVQVSDGNGGTDTQAIAVTVTNVNEGGVGAVTDANAGANSVAENAANGTVVGVTAAASDPDSTDTVSYSLDDSAGGRFAIDANSGVVTVANGTLLDREAAASQTITVRATSSDGSFSTANFTINLTDIDEFNVGAITDSNGAANSVAENAANGTVVGITASASDADATNNTVTYALTDDAGGRFAIDANSGVVTVADGSLLNREAAASHTITVLATSADGSTSSQSFSIAVGDVDEFDVGAVSDTNAGANSVAENAANGTVVGITASASDADATNNTVTYALTDDAGGRFAIDANTGVVSVANGSLLDREAAASHTITVQASSADGSTSTQSFSINVTDVDEFDVGAIADANNGANTVAENAANGTVVSITASASDADATNNTVTYTLTDDAGGRFAINSATGVVTVADGSLLDREAAASHGIIVLATSSDGSSSSASFTINVSGVNDNAPVITSDGGGASVAISVAENSTAVTTVTATDADVPAQTLSYSIVGGADAALFSINATTGALSFVAAPNYESPTDSGGNNVYDVTVQVSDGNGGTDTQAIAVTVTNVNEGAVGVLSDANAAANAVAENTANGTSVGVTAAASDPDSTDAVSYSLDDSAGGRFAINASTGVVTVANGALLNREAAASHTITVRASSSDGSSSTANFTINVSDVDEFDVAPVTDSNAAANSVAENAANGTLVGITASANDADATNNTVTYSLTDDAGGRFAIDANTGVVTVADGSLLDREAAPTHGITVRATSSDGSFNTASFTINLTDIDEFNVGAITDSNAAANSVGENAANGTTVGITALANDADATTNGITYSLSDSAGGRFAIDANSGVVTVANGTLLDREAAASHGITVVATSADGSSSSQSFTINLTDVDEFNVGAVSDANAAPNIVAENTANGTLVGISASASDADATSNTVTYALTDDAGGRFAIDPNTGVVTVANGSLLNCEAAASHSITIQATSADGSSSTQSFTINVTDVDEFDVGPVTDNNAAANTVAENAANGTTVGITAFASDADSTNNTISYSLTDDAGGRFAIDANTGVVTVANGALLDREVVASHAIAVLATSADGSTSAQNFTIAVGDVDEYDVGALTDADAAADSVAENAASGTLVGITAVASDADATNNAITYSLDDSAGGRFAIDGTTGVVTVATGALLDREAAPSHGIVVRATSADGSVRTASFTINLTDVDEYDVGAVSDINAGANSVAENAANGTLVGVTASASDADATTNTIVYTLTDDAGGRFAIDANTGVVTVANGTLLDREAAASHGITVLATSSDGSSRSASFTINVTGENDNLPVIASDGGGASAAISVAENATAVTTVTATDADLPAQTLSYSIVGGADAALFSINATTGALSFTAAPNFEAPADAGANNVYDVTVQVSDGNGGTDTQAIAVTVTDVNEAPVITSNGGGANAAVSVAENSVAVTTVACSDVDGGAPSYSIVGGADAVLFSINSTTGALSFNAAPNFEAPGDADADNVYDVTVQVSDGAGGTDTQTIAVTVTNVNEAPAITSDGGGAGATVSMAENATAVTTVTSADVDGGAPSYSIVGGADAALFSINAATGALSFNAAPDYESPADAGGNNTYDVVVEVSDGNGGTDTQAIGVVVTPVNDHAPAITSDGGGASAALSVAENTTAVTTVTATDADLPVQTLGYSIAGGADAALFSINAATGALRFSAAPNFEAPGDADGDNVYEVTVQVSDGAGGFDTQAISVTVTNVNEAPAITSDGGGATASVSVAENTTAVTTVASADVDGGAPNYSIVGGADAARFSIDATTGVLRFNAAPDHEAPVDAGGDNVYDVTVQVADGNGGLDTQDISVTVTNVNEAPVITSDGAGAAAALGVVENATAVTTVTSSDVDGGVPSYSIAGGADAALFSIDAASGALRFNVAPDYEAPADADADNNYDVMVQVSDGNGGTDTQLISVAVTGTNDNAPVIGSDGGGANASVSVAENTTAVTTVTASDGDLPAQILSYTIVGGADAGLFSINAATGVLRFNAAPDHEAPADAGADNTYNVTVEVSDGNGGIDTQAIAVTVTNVNEAPVITSDGGGAAASVSVVENGTATTVVVGSDVDGDVPAYSIIGGSDAALFSINAATGALSFSIAPNFEAPADANADNIYDVTIQVADGNGGTDTQAIAVAVTDVNEAPSGTNATVSTSEDIAYTFAAADFGFADADAGDTLSAVRVDSLPAAGRLHLAGAPVGAGQVIGAAQIADLAFDPAPDANGAGYASFDASVRDQSGAYAATPNTVIVNVTAVDDAPVLRNAVVSLRAGERLVLSTANFGVTDVDSPLAALVYTVSNVHNGQFERTSTPGVSVTSFGHAELAQGIVQFVHAGAVAPSFDIRVGDGVTDSAALTARVSFVIDAVPDVAASGGNVGGGTNGGTSNASEVSPLAPAAPATSSAASSQAPIARIEMLPLESTRPAPAAVSVAGGPVFEAAPVAVRSAGYVASDGVRHLVRIDVQQGEERGDLVISLSPAHGAAVTHFESGSAMPESAPEEHTPEEIALDEVRLVGLTMSVGMVWWAARVSGLMASVLATSPAWRQIDLLPILGRPEDEDEEGRGGRDMDIGEALHAEVDAMFAEPAEDHA